MAVAWKAMPVALGVTATAVMVMVAGCGSGGSLPQNSVAATVRAAPSPAPGTSVVQHWGVFFGGGGPFYDLQKVPVTVTLPGKVVQIGTSNSDDYALMSDGSVYAWGMGTQGELGDGKTVNSFETPVRVDFPAGVKIAFLATDAMPYDSALAVDTQGHAWAWGVNTGGEFCTGNDKEYLTPVELPFGDVTMLAGADAHALYVSYGSVFTCGDNLEGDLGNGGTNASYTPVQPVGLGSSAVAAVTASFDNSGVLLANGDYYDWGYNQDGQLGDDQAGGWSDVPVRALLPGPVRQVALGGSIWGNGQTLALLKDGALYAWGSDFSFQLAQGIRGMQPVPAAVLLPAGVSFTGLATGSSTCYGMTPSGKVYSWGASYAGQLGNGTLNQQKEPEEVAVGATQISSTANNTLILLG